MSFVLHLYRVRGIIVFIAVALCLLGAVRRFIPRDGGFDALFLALPILGILGLLSAALLTLFSSKFVPVNETIRVGSPVTGRWLGMNSPVDKVPSHGVRAYGQAYALDLVAEPVDQERPEFGSGPAMRRPEEYPAFGEPLHAMVDGIIISISDTQRDHRARSGALGVLYMMVEGTLRELAGPRFIIGNHVTIRCDAGNFALVAHLQKGSARVSVGDRVRAGQVIAACGNSGNSSEPHVHAQLMDRRSVWTGQGIPFTFANVRIDGDERLQNALPGNFQHMTVDPHQSAFAPSSKKMEE